MTDIVQLHQLNGARTMTKPSKRAASKADIRAKAVERLATALAADPNPVTPPTVEAPVVAEPPAVSEPVVVAAPETFPDELLTPPVQEQPVPEPEVAVVEEVPEVKPKKRKKESEEAVVTPIVLDLADKAEVDKAESASADATQ